MNISEIDMSYESSLLAIVSDVNKMKLMELYISNIANEILNENLKRNLIESAISGDEKMMAVYFHDLDIPQKKVIIGLLIALRRVENLDDLTIVMKPIIDHYYR